jgi:hypothetical protein
LAATAQPISGSHVALSHGPPDGHAIGALAIRHPCASTEQRYEALPWQYVPGPDEQSEAGLHKHTREPDSTSTQSWFDPQGMSGHAAEGKHVPPSIE